MQLCQISITLSNCHVALVHFVHKNLFRLLLLLLLLLFLLVVVVVVVVVQIIIISSIVMMITIIMIISLSVIRAFFLSTRRRHSQVRKEDHDLSLLSCPAYATEIRQNGKSVN